MRPAWTLILVSILLMAPLVVLAPTSSAASAETVAKLPPLGDGSPRGIVGASAAFANGATYLFGGRLANGDYSDKIYKYVYPNTLAEQVATLPGITGSENGGRQSGTAVTLGTRIYYFGGAGIVQADLNGDGASEAVPRAIKDIVEFDPATNVATKMLDELPIGMWGIASASFTITAGKPQAFLFGGFSFDVSNLEAIGRYDTIYSFDPSATTGQRLDKLAPTLPYRVQDAAAAALNNNRIYIFGGLSDNDNNTNPCPMTRAYNQDTQDYEDRRLSVCTTDGIVSFDPATKTIRDYSGKLPQRAQFLHAASYRGKAYLPGARLSDGTASAAILEFSPTASPPVRELAPTLPAGIFGAPVSLDTDGNIFVFGGRLGGLSDLTDSIIRVIPKATAPTAPRALTTTPISGGLRLEWEAPAYDGDSPVTSYKIYRNAIGDVETLIGEATTLTYDDKTAKPGTDYAYRVTAVNSAGESALGASTSRVTEATVPGVVGDFAVYAGNQEVLLRWSAPKDNGGANITVYRVYRDGSPLAGANLPASATEFRDTGLQNDKTYQYNVRAGNIKGDGPASRTLTASPAPVPAAPQGLTASAVGESVRLAWRMPEAPVQHFVIYRGETPGGLVIVANATQAAFDDIAIVRGKTYYYAVAAANAVGLSPPSTLAMVSLVTKPGAPKSVFAAPLEGAIRLTWQAPDDTGEAPADALRYYVSRQDPGAARFRILDTDGDLAATTYTDPRVLPGVEYVYTVTALNPLASDPSAEARGAAKAVVNKVPTPFLEVRPLAAQPRESVEFDASKSTDPDGAIVAYEFDFGDGTEVVNGTDPIVTHVFVTDKFYPIRLRVIDDKGATSEPVTVTLKVGEPAEKTETGTGATTPPSRPAAPPGTETGGIPGPGLWMVLGAIAVALLARRRALG